VSTDGGGSVAERLVAVQRRVAAATPSGTRALLVAVSKGQPSDAMLQAYRAGQRDFGENYVQELTDKAAALADLPDIRFHLIGHLQRNKARYAVRLAQAVHSVDSVALAEELGRRAQDIDIPEQRRAFGNDPRLPVFAEVSIAGEAQKSGVSPALLGTLLDCIEGQAALRLVGLMAVPPLDQDAEAARPHFEALVRLRDTHGGASRLPELSMGMTQDFEQALAAGATVVRIGSAIFGPRRPRATQGG
jgi:pyridoxal phosphate enzyme (YggS family)